MYPDAVARTPFWPSLVSDGLKFAVPTFLEPVVDLAGRYPWTTCGLVLFLVAMRRASTTLMEDITEGAFRQWCTVLEHDVSGADIGVKPWSLLEGVRRLFSRVFRFVRPPLTMWPKWLSLGAIALLIFFVVNDSFFAVGIGNPEDAAPVQQIAGAEEPCGARCSGPLAVGQSVQVSIRAEHPENHTGVELEKNGRYELQYVHSANWEDKGRPVPPGGFRFGRLWRWGPRRFWWMTHLRPYPPANWFEVIGQVGGTPQGFQRFTPWSPLSSPRTAASSFSLSMMFPTRTTAA